MSTLTVPPDYRIYEYQDSSDGSVYFKAKYRLILNIWLPVGQFSCVYGERCYAWTKREAVVKVIREHIASRRWFCRDRLLTTEDI